MFECFVHHSFLSTCCVKSFKSRTRKVQILRRQHKIFCPSVIIHWLPVSQNSDKVKSCYGDVGWQCGAQTEYWVLRRPRNESRTDFQDNVSCGKGQGCLKTTGTLGFDSSTSALFTRLIQKNPFILHIYTVVTYISDRAGVSKILMTWCMKRLYLITVLVRVIFLVIESLGEDNTDCVLNTAASILKKKRKEKKNGLFWRRDGSMVCAAYSYLCVAVCLKFCE